MPIADAALREAADAKPILCRRQISQKNLQPHIELNKSNRLLADCGPLLTLTIKEPASG